MPMTHCFDKEKGLFFPLDRESLVQWSSSGSLGIEEGIYKLGPVSDAWYHMLKLS